MTNVKKCTMFSNTPPKHCISGALFHFLFDNNNLPPQGAFRDLVKVVIVIMMMIMIVTIALMMIRMRKSSDYNIFLYCSSVL